MYPFKFKGGSTLENQKQIKFHAYITDDKGNEKHLYEAERMGIVERRLIYSGEHDIASNQISVSPSQYDSAHPVIKIFTSTKGFGIASEYFSYFFLISRSSTKLVKVRPLGYKYLPNTYYFEAQGRFLTSEEIGRLYGTNSNTFKYFKRQAMISKRRLLDMVTIQTVDSLGESTQTPVVRKLRV